MEKRGVIEFNWIFAVIVGAAILFLAIFFVGRLTGTTQYLSETELAKNFDILLNPFASIGGIGQVSLAKTIDMPQAIQINQTCNAKENRITMFLRSESSIGKKWGEWSAPNQIYNKYIFSGSFMEGKSFDVMSKSFEMPFRIDDTIYILDKDYCFVNAPSSVKEELEWINLTKVQFVDSASACTTASLKVCFDMSCDIKISGQCVDAGCADKYDYGTVQKSGKSMDYATSSLMYAAIFSDSAAYNCETSRLISRLKSIAGILKQKASRLSGCPTTELISKLSDLESSSSSSIIDIYKISQEVNNANPIECPIF